MPPVWIHQRYNNDEIGAPGPPFVMGSQWMLEMHRCDSGRTCGLFLAAFGIMDLSHANLTNGEFVGFSMPGAPPASWLTESLVFELGSMPLAESPNELIALVKTPRPFTSVEVGSNASPRSQAAKQRIIETYCDGVSIADIARALGITHAHLTRQFKHDFAITPLEYRHQLQVRAAVERMSQGERIVDAAYNAGFNEVSRFYDDFRKVTATSPRKCVELLNTRSRKLV